ncbi:MAG TPA: 16S rRNA (guanine(527)-N(7))-methyltransferase RsmG [Methylophilaceae bacterium]|nr:16S rRNA (guanine(527)-N(7))-methyltransferase RsmG [Methylophilaceae bacterium]
MTLQAKLNQGLEEASILLSPDTKQKLLDYLGLMQKWNKVHNLTAVSDPEEMVTLHLLDSLSVLPHVRGERLVDVGSGAGLPGIPLALCKPELQVTVLDSSHKKASFMRQAKAELGIDNLEVVCARVEAHKPQRLFDTVISRAFSDLAEFMQLTRHLGNPQAQWLAMKGVYPFEELAQAKFEPVRVLPLKVPGLEAQRHLVFLSADNLKAA